MYILVTYDVGTTSKEQSGSLEEIREYVFYQCPAITEIDIPANVTKMSEYSVCDNANTVTTVSYTHLPLSFLL